MNHWNTLFNISSFAIDGVAKKLKKKIHFEFWLKEQTKTLGTATNPSCARSLKFVSEEEVFPGNKNF